MAPPDLHFVGTPVEYPEDAANTVHRFARILGNGAAIAALEFVQNMVGNPTAVQRSVTAWDNATLGMNGAFSAEGSAHSALAGITDRGANWRGPAYEGFTVYFDDLKKTTDDNVGVLTDVAQQTTEFYEIILSCYKQCVAYIVECAAALTSLGGELLGDWKTIVAIFGAPETAGVSLLLLAPHFGEYLDRMTKNVGERAEAAIDAFSDYNSTLMKLSSTLKKLASPGAPADNLWGLL